MGHGSSDKVFKAFQVIYIEELTRSMGHHGIAYFRAEKRYKEQCGARAYKNAESYRSTSSYHNGKKKKK